MSVSSSAGRVRILWNPASGRGRGARAIGQVLAAFGEYGISDHRHSLAPGDEARLVQEAIADGVETIVVAGGDGTWSKCAVALARAGSPARMAFVAAGTGNDFAKNLRVSARDARAVAAVVARGGVERRVDLGRVEDTWFLNVAGFGFDVAVLEASSRVRMLRGPLVYVATAVRELSRFNGLETRVEGVAGIDGAKWARRLLLVFSNGREFGGAFKIAPPARVDDGKIDAVICGDDARIARLPLLARAIGGTHLSHPAVKHTAGASFQLHLQEPTAFEADGELCVTTASSVTVSCVPGALRVVDAPG